jgi:hypothetical protein
MKLNISNLNFAKWISNIYNLGEKLVVFIEFKKEILRTYVLRMTVKGWMINIRKKATLFVILSEAKNLIFSELFKDIKKK